MVEGDVSRTLANADTHVEPYKRSSLQGRQGSHRGDSWLFVVMNTRALWPRNPSLGLAPRGTLSCHLYV